MNHFANPKTLPGRDHSLTRWFDRSIDFFCAGQRVFEIENAEVGDGMREVRVREVELVGVHHDTGYVVWVAGVCCFERVDHGWNHVCCDNSWLSIWVDVVEDYARGGARATRIVVDG